MRTYGLFLSCAALMLPTFTLAAPSADAIFTGVYETKLPLKYTFESHSERGNTAATVKASGMQEGRGTEWYKQRTDVSLAVAKGGDSLSLHAKMTVYGDMLYVRIAGADIMQRGKTTHVDATEWAAMPLHGMTYDQGMFPFLDLWNALGMDETGAADAWMMFRDASGNLSVEETRFAGGAAYALGNAGNPVLRARFNSNAQGGFLYAKAYMSDRGFALSGETQPNGKGVVVDIPKGTISPETLRYMLEQAGVFSFLSDTQWDSMSTAPATPSVTSKKSTVTTAKNRYARPVYVPREEASCLQAGYTMTGCGVRYTKREIHQNEDAKTIERGWKERVSDDRIVDSFDTVAKRFETAARRNNLHAAKTMLSNFTIRASGSDDTDSWLREDILPFFHPTEEAIINQTVFLLDDTGHEGVAIEKVTHTLSGRRRYFVIVLLLERMGAQPVVADIFINATLRDLKGKGWIEQ